MAIVAAVLAVVPHLAELPGLSPALLGARIAVRAVTYVIVAAIVLSFRRSFDREHHLAVRDRMTDALNKETFRERVIHRLDLAVPARHSFLLAILDLDDFKGINNRHGHVAGDEVLRAFAQGARKTIRREDDFGRIGGDEFAFLLPVHSAEEGVYFARLLHKRLSSVLADTPHPVTCSMGALLISPDTPRDEPSLMHAVDQLMYAVKRAGKNAVEIGRAMTDRGRDAPVPSRLRVPIEACL
ncbi:GGDEF domain-containing protein [Sphingomonas paucimobilis]|uniref:GGDEF domain-containing protein n=1 Tax=Sphingomonas paucimobilis TaxID=13689 RepID=UPI001F3BB440|nr:GGDEF domain-containing protein [Sphingomonas paucimobilis]